MKKEVFIIKEKFFSYIGRMHPGACNSLNFHDRCAFCC